MKIKLKLIRKLLIQIDRELLNMQLELISDDEKLNKISAISLFIDKQLYIIKQLEEKCQK